LWCRSLLRRGRLPGSPRDQGREGALSKERVNRQSASRRRCRRSRRGPRQSCRDHGGGSGGHGCRLLRHDRRCWSAGVRDARVSSAGAADRSSRDWRLLLRADVYGKFSNSISYDHQLILRHVLALDYGLQVQQCLQSRLFTSIKWVLCKFRLLRNDQLLDIIFQLVYAYPGLWSAIDGACGRLLIGGIWRGRRRRLWSAAVRDCILALESLLTAGTDIVRAKHVLTLAGCIGYGCC
jgi:hypothetical protein